MRPRSGRHAPSRLPCPPVPGAPTNDKATARAALPFVASRGTVRMAPRSPIPSDTPTSERIGFRSLLHAISAPLHARAEGAAIDRPLLTADGLLLRRLLLPCLRRLLFPGPLAQCTAHNSDSSTSTCVAMCQFPHCGATNRGP